MNCAILAILFQKRDARCKSVVECCCAASACRAVDPVTRCLRYLPTSFVSSQHSVHAALYCNLVLATSQLHDALAKYIPNNGHVLSRALLFAFRMCGHDVR